MWDKLKTSRRWCVSWSIGDISMIFVSITVTISLLTQREVLLWKKKTSSWLFSCNWFAFVRCNWHRGMPAMLRRALLMTQQVLFINASTFPTVLNFSFVHLYELPYLFIPWRIEGIDSAFSSLSSPLSLFLFCLFLLFFFSFSHSFIRPYVSL